MASGPRYSVQYRRRRIGKTNYRKRLALLKSRKVRAVVRKSLSGTSVQFVDIDLGGDRVLAHATYADLRKMGWKHSLKDTTASYLTGLLAGIRARSSDIDEAVLDIGLNEPIKGSKVFAALKGMLDSGLDISHGEGMFPSDDRIDGSVKGDDGTIAAFEEMKKRIMEARI
ncbi:MAG: 50S ribosomal protein L18 [Candidatus Thermoplasmatota archaeon]|nr:50S ribosomal protein L18 [Candidatus Thermoplasmatota archaeon]